MANVGARAAPANAYIAKLKASRRSAVVLKTKLAGIRSRWPERIVFAFEGDDDKAVYVQWSRRISADLRYEPMPCDGKSQVFEFREMLERDKGDLSHGVYFFVDRDFDDLKGYQLGAKTFMTDRYSVENYLVTTEVLEELLKDEFNCHAEPAIREKVLNLFERQLCAFLDQTADLNFRIFLAQRLGIAMLNQLPDKVRRLAKIELDAVYPAGETPYDIVKLASEPSPVDRDRLKIEFDAFDRQTRYRGKFQYAFMLKWLELLCTERANAQKAVFHGIGTKRVNYSGITIGMLASKSVMPAGLSDFILAAKF